MSEHAVSKLRRRLLGQYAAALRNCFAREQEHGLQQAYELGRDAIARGMGVLDMARLHQEGLSHVLQPLLPAEMDVSLRTAGALYLEALTPFEATHRGFRETCGRLSELNRALEQRNLELAAINRRLRVEIGERKRTEAALRLSEKHSRELLRQAQSMQEDLRRLSEQILHVQEQERTRISRELHDEVGQALTAVTVSLAMLTKQIGGPPASFAGRIKAIQTLVEQTMDTVHAFARELRPAMLDELGLLPALRSYLKAFQERTGIRTCIRVSPRLEQLNEGQKTTLFRVVQECLTNITKHAQASSVAVAISHRNGSVRMEINDNGRGFKVEPSAAWGQKKRLGVLGMQERVRLVNGTLTLHSQPGQGTVVRVEIPLSRHPATILSGSRVRAPQRAPELKITINRKSPYAKNHRIAGR